MDTILAQHLRERARSAHVPNEWMPFRPWMRPPPHAHVATNLRSLGGHPPSAFCVRVSLDDGVLFQSALPAPDASKAFRDGVLAYYSARHVDRRFELFCAVLLPGHTVRIEVMQHDTNEHALLDGTVAAASYDRTFADGFRVEVLGVTPPALHTSLGSSEIRESPGAAAQTQSS